MTTLTVALATGLIAYTTGFVNTGAEEPPDFNPEPVVDEHGNVVIHHSDGENVDPERLKVQITVEKQDGDTISGAITELPSNDPQIDPGNTEGELNFDNRYGAVTKSLMDDQVTASERIGFGLNTSIAPRDKVTVTVIDQKTNHVIEEETVVPENRVSKAPVPSNFFETASYTTGSTTVIDGYKTKYSRTSPGGGWSREGFSHYTQVQDGWHKTTSRFSPGSEWTRVEVDHYTAVQTGTKSRIDDDSPGWDWTRGSYQYTGQERVQTDHKVSSYGGWNWVRGSYHHSEYETDTKYTWSEHNPGGGWSKTGDSRRANDWGHWTTLEPSLKNDYSLYKTRQVRDGREKEYHFTSRKPQDVPNDWVYTGRTPCEGSGNCDGTTYRYYEWETSYETEYKYATATTEYEWEKEVQNEIRYYNYYKYSTQDVKYYKWTKPTYSDKPVYSWKKPAYTQEEVYEWKKPEYTTVSESFELAGDSSWTIAENVREMKNGEITVYSDELGMESEGPFTLAAEGSSGTWTMQAYKTSTGVVKVVVDGRTIYEGAAERVTVDFTENKLTVTKADGTTTTKPAATNLGDDLDTEIGEYDLAIYNGDEARGTFDFVVDGGN